MESRPQRITEKRKKVTMSKDSLWDIQKYRTKLRHDLRLALLKRRYDFRAQLKKEFWLSYYLVDTRKDLKSGDDQGRCDLDEKIYLGEVDA